MGTGPGVESGFDLALTELGTRFLVEVGSQAGADVLAELQSEPAADPDREQAAAAVQTAAAQQTRHLDTTGIKELLYENFDHPRWDNVANRCLSCANCTMVCPTCFCTTVEDTTRRDRRSRRAVAPLGLLFHAGTSLTFTAAACGPRNKARYRQWMTHKLASWIDQFGSSGCVGCGRCITWCPVGIDITEEIKALRQDD